MDKKSEKKIPQQKKIQPKKNLEKLAEALKENLSRRKEKKLLDKN